ncbi:MAG: hypothetical protein HUU20_26320 [Pirellulales bacterium]|nr:hypothetical protein [Pirellulales bacterium]
MIRYHYLTQLQPPAPFVHVTLRNPVTGAEEQLVPAQLDTAADRTLLPDTLVRSLALAQIGTVPIGGVGGITQTMPSYPVQVAVHNLPPQVIEAVASAGEAWVLLGRDLLNSHRLLLDGPQLFLEIG